MGYLIAMLVAVGLLASFFVLSEYEGRRGVRFFAVSRAHFDRRVKQIGFILTHVDFHAFLRAEILRLGSRIGHDIVLFSLQVVRITERLLTRVVRYFRTRHSVDTAPRESAREFVRTLTDFKDNLKSTHPDISDIKE